MDTFIRFLAVVLAIILLLLFPLQYIAQSQDETMEDVVHSHVREFTETARNQGSISFSMYERLQETLAKTGEQYDLSLTVSHPVTAQELNTVKSHMTNASLMTRNKSTSNHKSLDNTILNHKTLDKTTLSNKTLNKAILSCRTLNKTISSEQGALKQLATHIHTDDCYEGHRHTPIFGSVNLSDVPVIMNREFAYNSDYGHYMTTYYVKCAICKKTLYEFAGVYDTSTGKSYGYTSVYNRSGMPIKHTFYRDDRSQVVLDLQTELKSLLDNNGGTSSSNNYTTKDIRWGGSFKIVNSDASGLIYAPVVCWNTQGHENPAACYSLGYRGNVIVTANIVNHASDNGSMRINVDITCANCGRTIFSTVIMHRVSWLTSQYVEYIDNRYSYWDDHGVKKEVAGIRGIQANVGQLNIDTNHWNNLIGQIYNTWYHQIFSLPRATYFEPGDGSYYITTPVITNPFNDFQTVTHVGDCAEIQTFPMIGCTDCGSYGSSYSCGQVQDDTPDCDRVVMSITPVYPIQTVNKGENINTTAIATFMDGHTGIVSCTSNFNPNLVGNQMVTLTYTGLVGNAKTIGSRTCTVSVTVKETNIPSYLTVTPSSHTVYNGNKPSFTVVVTYTSGNTKTIAAGSYAESGWSSGSGTKNLTFTYTENSVTVSRNITITVLPNLSGISVTPASQSVKRYAQPSFTVTVHYEDSSSKVVTSGYTLTGLNNMNLGLQTASISYSENNITRYATAAVTFTKLTTTCPVCGSTYELDENDTDRGCPVCGSKVVKLEASPYRVTVNRGEALPIMVTATFQNGVTAAVTGWTSNYDPNVLGTRRAEISYLGVKCFITVQTLPGKVTCPICGNSYDLNPDGTDPGCPICSKTVTGITVLEDSVTIEKFDILPITVTAKYKDNHTAVVYDWSTNFVPDKVGLFEVTIFYHDFTDTVMVKVLDENEVTCPICGTVYKKSENPSGCPVCSVTLTSIKAKLRNGGTQVIYKSEIRLEITLIFRDKHEELTYSGYSITGYNPEVLGFQDIVVHYKEFTTTLRIEVIKGPARVVCPKGHEYYLNEDGTDPGCPICESTGKEGVITYFEATYTPEILQRLIENGEYHIKKGDYLTVTITRRDSSVRSKLRNMFFNTNKESDQKKYTYGGEVY